LPFSFFNIGVGGDLIICEEAAAMDTRVFYEVVVPLLELDRTALICISTIKESFNFYSRMLNLKDENDEPFFVTHIFTLACEDCKKLGKPEQCTHMFHHLPPWQSARKHIKIRAMMSDEQQLMQRETMGLATDQFGRAFTASSINAFVERPTKPVPQAGPRAIFITIDPSGGGKSHFALVSCYYREGGCIVAGLESIPAKCPADYERMLRQHWKTLREIYPGAVFFACPESNLGFESTYIARVLNTLKSTIIMYESKPGVPGICTTHKTKEVCQNLCQERLDENAFHMSSTLVTSGDATKMTRELMIQLRNYCVVIDLPDALQAFRFAKKTYSGKIHGNDDLIMMLQLNLLVYRRWRTSERYAAYR